MKAIKVLIGFLLPFIIFGCTGKEPLPVIELDADQSDVIFIDQYGRPIMIKFTSALDWTVEMQGCDGWITVKPMSGIAGAGKVIVDVDKNPIDQPRTAVISICSGSLSVPVTIEQEAFNSTFQLDETEDEISAAGATVTVKVITDIDYEYNINADWIKPAESKALRTREHIFVAEPNPDVVSRSAVITFTSAHGICEYKVIQRPAGTEADDWKFEDFVRRSLAMRFTADWCGYCPNMAKAFQETERQMNGRFEVVSLHGGESRLEFESVSYYLKRFKVSGFPTGIIDVRASIPNYTDYSVVASLAKQVAEETQTACPTQTGIALNSSLDGSTLTVDLSLYVKEADTYNVAVLLLEDNIIGYQYGVSNPNTYNHTGIARKAITKPAGETVVIDKDYSIWTNTYTVDVPSVCDLSNLRVLVYVEKPYGEEVIVTAVEGVNYSNYGDTYIDNCRSVKVGQKAELELDQ